MKEGVELKYLITGGTGSFGKKYVKWLSENTEAEIVVFSRSEEKQWEMKKQFPNVGYIIGDVRGKEAVESAIQGIDYVIHTAALKHVSTGENQPWETMQTNVIGTKNVVDACNKHSAKMVLLSTDKAVMPVNLYGASKMAAEKIAIRGGQSVVRYGNVFGSSGSILHIFKQQAAQGDLFTITDRRMTRFILTFDQAIELVNIALNGVGYTIPENLKGINIVDLAYAFDDKAEFTEIGIQPGEKLHELLQYNPEISSKHCDKYSIEEIRELINGV
jgi:UDP-N-acetylglucosamine 4,6-dehydratase